MMAEPTLKEFSRPWSSDCDGLSECIRDKRLLVTAIYSIATIDSLRGASLRDDLLDQFEELDATAQQIYASVLSRTAVLNVRDNRPAIEAWRRADQLSASAMSPDGCPGQETDGWRLKVLMEGILILTRAGLWEESGAERTEWLEEAEQLALAVGRPELAPVEEREPSDSNPKLIQFAKPVYSENARRARLEGEVVVKITIDEFGDVSHAEIMKSAHPALDEASVAAARKCRFAPGRRRGVPVKAIMALPYSFRLDED